MNELKIAEMLVEFRKSNHLSQGAVAEKLGITQQAVSKWERGVCYPDITVLSALAGMMRCRVDDFFSEHE